MDKSERKMLNDVQSDIWRLLKSKGEMKVPNLYKELEATGEDSTKIKKTIKSLKELSIVKENKDSRKEHIKLNELLTGNIRNLPCLGCQALEKCGVGENYSPENCRKLDFWIKEITSNKTKHPKEK